MHNRISKFYEQPFDHYNSDFNKPIRFIPINVPRQEPSYAGSWFSFGVAMGVVWTLLIYGLIR